MNTRSRSSSEGATAAILSLVDKVFYLDIYGDNFMSSVIFRKIALEECQSINEINPSQYIGKAWREVDGKRQLVEINYQERDWPNGYEYHISHLKETILNRGSVIGAYNSNNKLLGFATINRQFFDEKGSL